MSDENGVPFSSITSEREISDFVQFANFTKKGVIFSLFSNSKLENFSKSFLASASINKFNLASRERIRSKSTESEFFIACKSAIRPFLVLLKELEINT